MLRQIPYPGPHHNKKDQRAKTKQRTVLQNGLYCIAIWAVLHCDIGHIGGRYDTFRGAEKAVLEAEKGGFGGWFYCTIGLIRPISPIRPISYGCTLIFRVFAAGEFLFSNTRKSRGFFLGLPKFGVMDIECCIISHAI